MVTLPLYRLAYARSGDKGNSSNIAIIARKPHYLPLLRRELTPERMVGAFRPPRRRPRGTVRGARPATRSTS